MQSKAVRIQTSDRPVSGAPAWRACLLFGFGLAFVFLGDFSLESAACRMEASLFSGVSWAVVSTFLYSVTALLLAVLAFIRPGAIERTAIFGFYVVAVVFGGVGAIGHAMGAGVFAEGLFVVGMSCAGVPLMVLWLAQATRFYSLWARRCILAAMLIEAAVKAFAPYDIGSCWWTIGAYAGSSILLVCSHRLFRPLLFLLPRKRFSLSVDSKPVIGFLAVSLCAFAVLQAITGSEQNSNMLYALSLAIAAPIIWRTLAAKAFPSYSLLLKVIITLFIVTFVLFSCAQEISWMIALLAMGAGVLFWFGTVIMAVDVSSYTQKSPIAILAGIYALLASQGLFAPLVATALPSWSSVLDSHIICAAIVIILAMAYIWLLSERDVDNLFAQLSSTEYSRTTGSETLRADRREKGMRGEALLESEEEGLLRSRGAVCKAQMGDVQENRARRQPAEGVDGPAASAQQEAGEHQSCAIRNMARQYQLTAKEQQIIGMYAYGRSAPFIAEELVVSVNTVKSHLANAYQKIGVHSRQELISLLAEF